ncbi:urease accessory protein UreE [Psychrobacter sp. I-STPA6b]|uniref:urease accessory protein UreE n=1 Tax=Psychrobacter sp. I-STPA6b TaxID=2585718 RepID=UPI001D0C6EF5|nr:urease accessory protein UreE [Psychrobacter sp. I-STPA6b]
MPQLSIFTQRLEPTQLNEQQHQRIKQQRQTGDYLSLDYDTRQRSRFKAMTQSGKQVGIDLPRTDTLKDGSILSNDEGRLIQIEASKQTLTQVTAPNDDFFLLMKASYHLGNRHVPLMLTATALYFEPDHVLDDMLQRLGVQTVTVDAPFEPETGAYQQHNTHHHNNLNHSHAHSHPHSHAHT